MFKLARFTREFLPELIAFTVPTTFVLIDFVKSLAFVPIPVHTPPSQFPRSLPIAPFLTFASRLPPALIRLAFVP